MDLLIPNSLLSKEETVTNQAKGINQDRSRLLQEENKTKESNKIAKNLYDSLYSIFENNDNANSQSQPSNPPPQLVNNPPSQLINNPSPQLVNLSFKP